MDKIFIVDQGQIKEQNFSVWYYSMPKSYWKSFVELKEIATINPKREKPIFNLDDKVPYVWLPETDDWEIKQINYRPFKEVKGRNIIKKWDILFARIEPSIFNKKYIYVDDSFSLDFAYTSTEFYIIETKEWVNNKYIYYLLFHDEIYNQFSWKTTWSTWRRRLDKHTFESTKIPLPPLEIQNEIVEKMDQALAIKKQKEAEAKNLLDSIDDYVLWELGIHYEEVEEKKIFGISLSELGESKRFDCFYNNPKFIKQNKQINNWKYKLVTIKDSFQYINGFAFSSRDYTNDWVKLLTIKNITKTWVNFNNITFLPKEYLSRFKNFQIQKNDILFAMTWATIWKVCIFEWKENALLNQRCWAIRTDTENPRFLYTILSLKYYKTEILKKSCGWAQVNISHNDILNIKIPLPTIEIQDKIANNVKSIINKAKKSKQEADEVYKKRKEEVKKIILGE